jgi:cytidylate kinase
MLLLERRNEILYISVAIDGPAGAGKSTIANIIASKFNLMYINTGSMYRAVTLMALRNNINYKDIESICKLINSLEMRFEGESLLVNGEDVSEEIRNIKISNSVSNYAAIPEIREILVKLQQDMSNKYNVIMDGRDIGTVVLKNSPLKFFLTASPEERAKRRYEEFTEKGVSVEYNDILDDIIKRDYIDSNRKVSPLKKACDAVEVDSSNLSIDAVISLISNHIKDYIKKHNIN